MIVAVVVGGVVAVFAISGWLINKIHAREVAEEKRIDDLEVYAGISKEDRLRVIAEKRRVLERDRSEWMRALERGNPATPAMQLAATQAVRQLDKQLLELADAELDVLQAMGGTQG